MKLIKTVLVFVIGFGLIAGTASARPAWLDRRPEEKQKQVILEQSPEILSKLYQSQSEPRLREMF